MIRAVFIYILFCLLPWLQVSGQTSIDIERFYTLLDDFFKTNIAQGKVDYASIKQNPAQLESLEQTISDINIKQLEGIERQAYLINVYNLLVIKGIVEHFPIDSPLGVPGFFEGISYQIGQDQFTLNALENTLLFEEFKDPRMHFVLVCGAVDCPPIIAEAYKPQTLEQQLAQQTIKALNDPHFIRVDNSSKTIYLSEIFDWYRKDFDASTNKKLTNYINSFRNTALPESYKVKFYDYDWSLNSSSSSFLENGQIDKFGKRYFASRLYQKGEFELRIFNNYYTQSDLYQNEIIGNNSGGTGLFETQRGRYSFNSIFFEGFIGVNERINFGFDVHLRSVKQNRISNTPLLAAYQFQNNGFETENINENQYFDSGYSRAALSLLGLRVKYLPFKKRSQIAIQQTLYFSLGNDLEGNNETGYLDWEGGVFNTQLFYDRSLGNNFSFFGEVDLTFENFFKFFKRENGDYKTIGTPITTIFNYFPGRKITLYTLAGFAPRIAFSTFGSGGDLDTSLSFAPFGQVGGGVKYLIRSKFEIEFLYTRFIQRVEGQRANTLNIGFRFMSRK